MRVININLDELPTKSLDIGYVGESHHVVVLIHCASFFKTYPNAVASMVAEPPEGDIYPVNLERESSTLVWEIKDSDLVNAGSGKFQITFTQNTEIIKTAFGSFSVSASMVSNGEPPEPIEDWMQEAQQVLNDLESFNDMSASATMLPAGSTATAEMTTVEGHKNIALGIPKGDKGDKGNKGNTGTTPNISIGEIETLQPDQEAYVELDESSTPEAPVFNFGLPKGETGSMENVYGTTVPMSSTDSTKVATAIRNKANLILFADEWQPNVIYSPGDYVTHDGGFYSLKGSQPYSYSEWVPSMWLSETVSGKILSIWSELRNKKNKQTAVSDPTASGTDAEFISGITQDAQGVISPSKKTVRTMTGAGASDNGSTGLVPAPSAGDQGKFLRGDATWANVPNPQVMTGATASSAGSSGLVPAPSAGDQNKVLKGNGTWGNSGLLMVSQAFSIPSAGDSVTYTMEGMTASYQLMRWNFSVSAENSPPADLEWTTGNGVFTITNNGGDTSETIQPVFADTVSVAIEEYIEE